MYRNNFVKGDTILHTIDFSTLKKANSPVCKLVSHDFVIMNHPNPILLLLGAFAIIH